MSKPSGWSDILDPYGIPFCAGGNCWHTRAVHRIGLIAFHPATRQRVIHWSTDRAITRPGVTRLLYLAGQIMVGDDIGVFGITPGVPEYRPAPSPTWGRGATVGMWVEAAMVKFGYSISKEDFKADRALLRYYLEKEANRHIRHTHPGWRAWANRE